MAGLCIISYAMRISGESHALRKPVPRLIETLARSARLSFLSSSSDGFMITISLPGLMPADTSICGNLPGICPKNRRTRIKTMVRRHKKELSDQARGLIRQLLMQMGLLGITNTILRVVLTDDIVGMQEFVRLVPSGFTQVFLIELLNSGIMVREPHGA